MTGQESGLLHRMLFVSVLAIVCMIFFGCSQLSPPRPDRAQPLSASSEALQKDPPDVMTSLNHGQGSLWVDNSALGQMFINPKARKVGDILTINIVENSSATNKASTKTGRTSTLDAGLDNFFNLETNYSTTSPFFNPFGSAKGGLTSAFDGSGSTARSNALSAYMTARIVDTLPNGNLVIQGTREVRVNNENQIITLTGLVRPRDISADNVVQSTFIADARITYSGSGVINERQSPGWLTRLLGKIWPF